MGAREGAAFEGGRHGTVAVALIHGCSDRRPFIDCLRHPPQRLQEPDRIGHHAPIVLAREPRQMQWHAEQRERVEGDGGRDPGVEDRAGWWCDCGQWASLAAAGDPRSTRTQARWRSAPTGDCSSSPCSSMPRSAGADSRPRSAQEAGPELATEAIPAGPTTRHHRPTRQAQSEEAEGPPLIGGGVPPEGSVMGRGVSYRQGRCVKRSHDRWRVW